MTTLDDVMQSAAKLEVLLKRHDQLMIPMPHIKRLANAAAGTSKPSPPAAAYFSINVARKVTSGGPGPQIENGAAACFLPPGPPPGEHARSERGIGTTALADPLLTLEAPENPDPVPETPQAGGGVPRAGASSIDQRADATETTAENKSDGGHRASVASVNFSDGSLPLVLFGPGGNYLKAYTPKHVVI